MSEKLYPYYERELIFIRQHAQEFAERYPAAAGRLLLEPNQSGDPHIERLIESFALLSGRIHRKLDDEFPELTDALLSVMYPHFLAPIPSMAVVKFELDPGRGQVNDGFRIERGSRMRTAPVDGLPCRFKTGYPVVLWPLKIAGASLQSPPFPPHYQPPPRTVAALRLRLECDAQHTFSDLSIEDLRLYLFGDGYVVSTLYELIFNHTTQVLFRSLDDGPRQPSIVLSPEEALGQVGFRRDESLIPCPAQSFSGYRLLSEFFAFREKFQFVDVRGWQKLLRQGVRKQLEVVLFLKHSDKRLEEWVEPDTFQTGCTPVVNLFEQIAEPIALDRRRFQYRVVPDVAHTSGMEVYSIDRVTGTDPVSSTTIEFRPFYSFHHGDARKDKSAFWYATRRRSMRPDDRGTDVSVHLVDLDFQPRMPSESTLVIRTTCTNRDLPARLQHVGERLFFELEGAAPLKGIRCLKAPTVPLRPPHRRGRYWGLVSHLNLNYLSLAGGEESTEALREILRLYDFSDPGAGQQQLAEVTRQIIEGVTGVHTRRIIGRAGRDFPGGFCRGTEIAIELDEQKYVGVGMFLFACVLEQFLGLYTTINSFTQLVGKTTQMEGHFKKWPRRAGEQQLL
jgi:type VI secretion system protein ImpG